MTRPATRSGAEGAGWMTPARARPPRGRRAAGRRRRGAPRADAAPRHTVGRRGRRLDDARARHVADDRADRLLLAVAARELVEVQVVAWGRALGRAHDRPR